MALRLHIEKRNWRCVYKKITMRLEKKIWAMRLKNGKKKCNLPPLVILVVVRELFRLGLDVMEPFSCSYSLLLGGE